MDLQKFSFNDHDVRVISVNGDPWFVATDVLGAIKSGTKVNALKSMISDGLGDEYLNSTPIADSLGREQETTIIHEAAVTFLVSRSRTETGKAFNKLLHAEILPTIRKTGKYEAIPSLPEFKEFTQPLLPTRDIVDYVNAADILARLPDNRLTRLLSQRFVHELSLDNVNQKLLNPAIEVQKQYTTATVRASQLGYSAKQIGNGTSLGKFVKAAIMPDFVDWQGQYKVNHFEVNENLDSRIHLFFGEVNPCLS